MFNFLKFKKRKSNNSKKDIQGTKLPHTQNQIDMITEMSNYYIAKDKLLQTLLVMVNYTQGIALWAKDSKDRYLFADQALRNLIFDGKDISEINGKTDLEILFGEASDTITIPNLVPQKLPKLSDYVFFKYPSYIAVDVITRSLGYACRFFKLTEDKAFDIWNTPIFNNKGELTHITGCLVDASFEREYRKCILDDLIEKGEAYQVDNSDIYYIVRYNFEDFTFKMTKENFASRV